MSVLGDEDDVAGLAGRRLNARRRRSRRRRSPRTRAARRRRRCRRRQEPELRPTPIRELVRELGFDGGGDVVPAASAWSAWSSCRRGAPKTVSRPSPTYLSTCPPWTRMIGTTRSKRRLSVATTSGAESRSARPVNPRTSTNIIVTSTSSPSSAVPSRRMCSATSRSTYRLQRRRLEVRVERLALTRMRYVRRPRALTAWSR